MKNVYIVIRTEGEYESRDYPVRAFASDPEAKAFAQECTDTFKRQYELFDANRTRHGDKWWEFDYKKTDAIKARYNRNLADRGCDINNPDVSWGVWEVSFFQWRAAMTDIVERLRNPMLIYSHASVCATAELDQDQTIIDLKAAADAIEQLREALGGLLDAHWPLVETTEHEDAACAKARLALNIHKRLEPK